MKPGVRTSVAQFMVALWRRRPYAMIESLGTMVLASLTEGVGLLILAPMLSLAGVSLGAGGLDAIASWLTSLIAAIGLTPSLPVVLSLTVAILALRTVLVQVQSMRASALARSIVQEERDRLFRAVVCTPWPHFVRLRGADLVHALTELTDRVDYAVRDVLRLLADVLTVSVSVAISLRVSWQVTLLVGVAGVTLLAILRVVRAPGRPEGELLIARAEALFRTASDTVVGMKVVKGYGAESRTAETFASANELYGYSYRAVDTVRARAAIVLGLGSAVLLTAMMYVALAVLHLAPAASLLLLAMYTRLVPRVATAQQSWHHLNEAMASWDAVQRLSAECEQNAEAIAPASPLQPRAGAPHVRFEDVTFRYEGAEHFALDAVSFDIPAGELTAILGPSGSGKTTALDLLVMLLHPDRGQIIADGKPLDAAATATWRSSIGLLPQDVLLFPGTVRENLEWASPGADDAHLRDALTAADATFVYELPRQLDTPIGDRGALLSGGERQRLALARALLRRPTLLVLDEATSALDASAEARVLETLSGLLPAITIVMVSHRPSVLGHASHLVRLERGRVIAAGGSERL